MLKTVAVACTLAFVPITTFAQHYTQTNLVSDLANVNGQPVAVQDPNLKNGWGLARSASSPWRVNNAGTGTSTLYSGTGAIIAPPSPAVVPNTPHAKGLASPTGIIFKGTSDFVIKNVPGKAPTPAAFIFTTQEGTAGTKGYADGLFGTLTPGAAELHADDHQWEELVTGHRGI